MDSRRTIEHVAPGIKHPYNISSSSVSSNTLYTGYRGLENHIADRIDNNFGIGKRVNPQVDRVFQ